MRFHPYQAISALAGSGKTYQLTSRFIALLAQGTDPSHILAITFTRKAAGEIFDRIVRRLSEAALTESGRKDLEQALREQLGEGSYGLTRTQAAGWLSGLVEAMPRLRIGTIDSLFAGILKAYAIELGLPRRQEILDGPRLDLARGRALNAALRTPKFFQDFLRGFEMATAGEKKTILANMFDFIESSHTCYLELPDEDTWGEYARIWPSGAWWRGGADRSSAEWKTRVQAFRERYLLFGGQPKGYAKAWGKILDLLAGGKFADALSETLTEPLMAAREDLQNGSAEIRYGRNKYALLNKDAEDAHFFLAGAVRGAIESILKELKGRWALMRIYDRACQSEMRAQGRLSFADIPILLGRMCAPGVKLDIDYRMDGQFDHYMLDEFQDTNAGQWRVIGRVADEVLQDSEGGRSFFYVGDVKQAIYGWRGGDSTLFEQVREYYRARFGSQPDTLNVSYRSSPVVLAAMNLGFGNMRGVACINAPYAGVAERWASRWENHTPAPKNEKMPGRVEWHEVDPGDQKRDGKEARISRTCRIVKNLRDQGVENIGILVRSNDMGDQIADALRRKSIPMRRESEARLMDNGTVSALLSLLTLADHPGDDFAWPHLQMTPLWPVLKEWLGKGNEGGAGHIRNRLAARLREEVSQTGVAGLLECIIRLCREKNLLPGAFIQNRLRQLLEAAADFDQSGEGGPGEFAEMATQAKASDPAAEGGVVVTTIHKAKGLEFDAVILPELQGGKRYWTYKKNNELHVGYNGTGQSGNPAEEDARSRWIFPLGKEAVLAADPRLKRFFGTAMEEKIGGEICLLYVAMTRARQGLYLVTEKFNSSQTLYGATFLRDALAPEIKETEFGEDEEGIRARLLFEKGDEKWPEATREWERSQAGEVQEKIPEVKPAAFMSPVEISARRLGRLNYATPSGEEAGGALPARLLFNTAKDAASERGILLHDLFARIEWWKAGVAEAVLAEYEREAGACPPAIRGEFIGALRSRELQHALSRPAGAAAAEVWREQAFEYADESEWMSGRMDRVVIERDAQGRAVSAVVADFKSDRVDGAAGLEKIRTRYRPQLARYVRVAARLLKLPEDRIRTRLILTATGAVVDDV